ncbi:unnamed protein product [Allacma fusca]|uniref:CHCH domain-containing protein n=1 Tax=Allacma fusca TaxID=39272 RepID=A0A8J2JVA4_9HEXA|nr:unnamed protein product [Allacma fusca]
MDFNFEAMKTTYGVIRGFRFFLRKLNRKQSSQTSEPPWRNWLARSAVNRESRSPRKLPPIAARFGGNYCKNGKCSKHNHELKNPCEKEQKLSYKCLADNNYDRDKCLIMFENYRNCREFWNKVERDRKRKGITPRLPWPEDREQVKQEYLKEWGMK